MALTLLSSVCVRWVLCCGGELQTYCVDDQSEIRFWQCCSRVLVIVLVVIVAVFCSASLVEVVCNLWQAQGEMVSRAHWCVLLAS